MPICPSAIKEPARSGLSRTIQINAWKDENGKLLVTLDDLARRFFKLAGDVVPVLSQYLPASHFPHAAPKGQGAYPAA